MLIKVLEQGEFCQIVEGTLSDGSKVYNIKLGKPERCHALLCCQDMEHAEALFSQIEKCAGVI